MDWWSKLSKEAFERILERGVLGLTTAILSLFIYLVYRDATLKFIPETVTTIQAGYDRMAEAHRRHLLERDAAVERLMAQQDRLTREVVEELKAVREARKLGR